MGVLFTLLRINLSVEHDENLKTPYVRSIVYTAMHIQVSGQMVPPQGGSLTTMSWGEPPFLFLSTS